MIKIHLDWQETQQGTADVRLVSYTVRGTPRPDEICSLTRLDASSHQRVPGSPHPPTLAPNP